VSLDDLLLRPSAPLPSPALDDFARASLAHLDGAGLSSTIDRATAAGALAPCVGFAFAGGYREALRALVPALPPGAFAALCATEEGGGHPRAIRTTFAPEGDRMRLRGAKRWATAAGSASRLLVVASEGTDAPGRNRLAVIDVPADHPGVRFLEMPPAPFAPEVPHFEVHLDALVDADARLPGDGYERYLKPFRTVEDIHVTAAILGYLLAEAGRHRFPRELRADLLAPLAALRGLASSPSSPATHLALDALFRGLLGLLPRLDEPWSRADAEGFARWQRDRPLLAIAGKVRAARTEAAWRAVDEGSPGTGNPSHPA
jgi:alkylation response protein AidB-like acyl-CoA dehydrogenase